MTAIACYAYLDLDGRGYIMEDEFVEGPLREDMAWLSAALPLYCIWGTPDYIDLDIHGRGEPVDCEKPTNKEDPMMDKFAESGEESSRKKILKRIRLRRNLKVFNKLGATTTKVMSFLRRRKHFSSRTLSSCFGRTGASSSATASGQRIAQI